MSAVDAATGQVVWRAPSTPSYAATTYSNGVVFAPSTTTFAVAAFSVDQRNIDRVATTQTGAAAVLTVTAPAGQDLGTIVDRIDPKTNKVSKSIALEVPGAKGTIAFGEGAVWVSLTGFPLTRIDPESETVAQQFYGAGGGGSIVTGAGAIWLSNPDGGTLLRIDPKRVLATIAE